MDCPQFSQGLGLVGSLPSEFHPNNRTCPVPTTDANVLHSTRILSSSISLIYPRVTLLKAKVMSSPTDLRFRKGKGGGRNTEGKVAKSDCV